MGIAPAALVIGAARQPLPYGLFSAFSMRPGGDRWESGVQFETGTCEPADGIGAVGCGDPQVQRITIVGSPTQGQWELDDQVRGVSDPLGVNATVAQVQKEVDDLLGGSGIATVTGDTGGPFTITWNEPGPQGISFTVNIVEGQEFDQGTIGINYTPGVEDQSGVGLPKTLDEGPGRFGYASEFTVYGHFLCSPVGWSVAAAQDMATAHLVAREEARVEQAFWTGDLGNTPSLRGSTVLGIGAALSAGLGALEDWLAANYGSLGVIHMTRGTAMVAAAEELVSVTGGRLTTAIGTPVVAGAGYDGSDPVGNPATPGAAWIYATPAMFGYRSEIFTSSNRPGDLFDRKQNDLYAIAERTYLLGFDPCGTAAVNVLLPTVAEPPS